MLQKSKAFSGYSVNDLARAKSFYGDVLGLHITQNNMGILELHLEGGNRVILYPKPDHQPATFTVLNFPVPDIEQTVAALTNVGVVFEQYEGNLQTSKNGIYRGGGPLIAWFKDPAGNILSVLEER